MDIDKIFEKLDHYTNTKRKVMVIDDDVSMTSYIEEVCLDFKVECYSFNNPSEAILQFPLIQPHLLIVDWVMKPIDGLSVIRTIRRKYCKKVPILFLTGVAQNDTHLKALKYKATAFIEKSDFYNEVLEAQIKSLLDMTTQHKVDSLNEALNDLFKCDKEKNCLLTFHNSAKRFIKTDNKISDVLEHTNLPKNKIINFIHKHFNMSAQDYIINYRLFKALNLLLSGLTINDVSEGLGYSSPANFSNAFKLKYRFPPLTFVKRYEMLINAGSE